MTIVVAARTETKTVIAADTLVIDRDNKCKIKGFSKLVKFKHFVVGFAGSGSAFTALQNLSTDGNYCKRLYLKMQNIKDVKKFVKDFYLELKEILDWSPGSSSGKEDEGAAVYLLIASSSGIWGADPYLCVVEYDTFACIGSGMDIATGAMSVLYPYTELNTESDYLVRIVEKAIMITCDNSTQCGLPLDIMEI